MKGPVLVVVPEGVVTVMGPLLALVGTAAVIWVAELTVNDAAAVPLNETPVAPDKFVPVSTTEVPTAPLVGANPVIVGGDPVTVNPPPPPAPGATYNNAAALRDPLVAVVAPVYW